MFPEFQNSDYLILGEADLEADFDKFRNIASFFPVQQVINLFYPTNYHHQILLNQSLS